MPISTEKLAYELQQLIIHELIADKKALFACSLVSWRWLKYSRSLRFLDKFYDISATTSTVEDILRLLKAPNSTLGGYVHNVCIWGPDVFKIRDNGTQETYGKLSGGVRDILSYLIPFSSLHTLKIQLITWNMIDERTKATLRSFPSLRSLIWDQVVFDHLSELILFSDQSFPELESLEVKRVHLEVDGPIDGRTTPMQFLPLPSPAVPRFTNLRNVALRGDSTTIPFYRSGPMGPILPLERLESLHLTAHKMGHHMSGQLINSVGAALKCLEIDIDIPPSVRRKPYQFGFSPFPISLSHAVNLQFLGIVASLSCVDLWWLKELLESSSNNQKLKTIRLSLFEEDMDEFDFPAIEHILINTTASKIEVSVDWDGRLPSVSDYNEILKEVFPELTKMGRLFFE